MKEQILATNGRFFSVSFIKKDGTERRMVARLGVKKNIKGIGLRFDPNDHNLMVVYDVHKRAYRMINLLTIFKFNERPI
jgi:hypothetical protein